MMSADNTEAALLSEFGEYLTVLTKHFSQPVQQAIQEAERQMMGRIVAHQTSVESASMVAQRALEVHQLALRTEVSGLADQVDAFKKLVSLTKADLVLSRENFEATVSAHLRDLLIGELNASRDQIEVLKRKSERIQHLIVAALFGEAIIVLGLILYLLRVS